MTEEYFPTIPGINMSKLQMAANSAYSITNPKDAKQIEKFINKHMGGKNLAILKIINSFSEFIKNKRNRECRW